jgi:hypothetical protein
MARFAIGFLVIAGALWFGEADADELWSHQPLRNGRKDPPRRWSELVGKNVAVEGIAWGSFEKGWGEYVILHSAKVYVPGADFNEHRMHGKLIRVEGTLKTATARRARPGASGPSEDFSYFLIERPRITAISEVTWPWLHVLDH